MKFHVREGRGSCWRREFHDGVVEAHDGGGGFMAAVHDEEGEVYVGGGEVHAGGGEVHVGGVEVQNGRREVHFGGG